MGQCGGKIWIPMNEYLWASLFLSGNQYNNKGQGLPISSSFKVKSSGFRIFCGLKPKVIRDATGYGKVNGLDSLLDDIDKALGVNLMALYSFLIS